MWVLFGFSTAAAYISSQRLPEQQSQKHLSSERHSTENPPISKIGDIYE
jgi:hypothetical protein